MKHPLSSLLFFLCFTLPLFSEEIGINPLSSLPEDKAFLSDYQCSLFPKGQGKDNFSSSIEQIEPVLSAECEPLTMVAGCVNVVSGSFFQIDRDLASRTIEPLHLTRHYDSSSQSESLLGFGFGSQFPLIASGIEKGARHHYAVISEREGFLIPYQGNTEINHQKICRIDPRLLEKGYTNMSRAAISGHANFTNWRAAYGTTERSTNGRWVVQLGDGSKRYYEKTVKISQELKERMNFPSKRVYLLTKEIKPNGNRLTFSYKTIHGDPCLVHVKTLNRTESAILNELKFSYSTDGVVAENSSGEKVEYFHEDEPSSFSLHGSTGRKVLKKMHSSQVGHHVYRTAIKGKCRKVVKVEKPEGRFIEVKYLESHGSKDGHVECLIEPLGSNEESVKTYRFFYGDNYTKVLDAHGFEKRYLFDSHQRLSSIFEVEEEKGRLIYLRHVEYEWSQLPGQDGWLRSKAQKRGSQIYHLKTYTYDKRGNVIRTTLYGNLTGERAKTFQEKNATDHYRVEYTYIDDERNLVKEKKTPEGRLTTYEYLPSTNLCTKIFESYDGKIQERTFYEFDENGEIARVTEDDGAALNEADLTDATFRKIKVIEAVKQAGPSFGKPEKEMDYCRDFPTGQFLLLKKTEFEYDAKGQQVKKRVYDSENNLSYETTKGYDDHGRLIEESNPLGHITRYSYDKNNNKTKEKLNGSGKSTYFEYDLGNRLFRKTEKHKSGEIFTTSYFYNTLNQLISETDSYGHETTYSYDRYGNQTKIVKPLMQDAYGARICPTIIKKYNTLNQAVSITDENGFTTQYSYNVYGSPAQIIHPDGATERFSYYPGGWLKQKWMADGSSVYYKYDPRGRVVKESFFDQNEALLKEEHSIYKGPLLKYKKDAMGLVTEYFYDGAGRKIEENIGSLKTKRFAYDGFDNIIKIEKEGREEIYSYDALNRVLSKTLQDSKGQVYAKEEYAYDIQGNQIQKAVWQSPEQTALYRLNYNSDGSLHWKNDPLGERHRWSYNHNHTNELGQKVRCLEMEDPLTREAPGRHIREADDAFHRTVNRDFYLGEQKLSGTRYDFDAKGNLAREHSLEMEEGRVLREYWVLRHYNNRGFLESETEFPQEKSTLYSYDAVGRLKRKTKPDGVFIEYSYDGLGNLQTKKSSDKTIDYFYEYDLRGNLTRIEDRVHNRTQNRTFDDYSRLKREDLSPGITLYYEYDALDRITEMTFPDGSRAVYIYDPFHLKKIQRIKPFQGLGLEIDCTSYDLRGNLLKSRSPAGEINSSYDLLGRAVHIQALSFESHLEKFDPVGNLLKMKQSDPSGTTVSQFCYDRFDHLTDETGHDSNNFSYDSIGNCLKKNGQARHIDALNRIASDEESSYAYDDNGNLIRQTHPLIIYSYDGLNRLTSCEKEGEKTSFLYDSFGRCLEISDSSGTKQLLYQGEQEIGSYQFGHLDEFRLIHPELSRDLTFAIELKGETFYPVQDFRGNICALQRGDGDLAEWYRYSAFGSKTVAGNLQNGQFNPWRFANRREAAGLLLFAHRFYNPRLMRWLKTDPLGFEEGLNLYSYVRNNPFCYKDPDGRMLFLVPLVAGAFGVAGVTISVPTLATVATTLAYSAAAFALGWGTYDACKWGYHHLNQVNDDDQVDEGKSSREEGRKKPRYDGMELGNDPTKCPEEGFEWRGRGKPETGKGSWVKDFNLPTEESLHPDLNHPPPKAPHWDYEGPNYPNGAELYLDGTLKLKD